MCIPAADKQYGSRADTTLPIASPSIHPFSLPFRSITKDHNKVYQAGQLL